MKILSSTQLEYRPEIDGLRAIAVLAVVLFHTNLFGVAGGYLGVDVFFVISGYLITSIISKEIKQKQFSFKSFFIRRTKRIMPALFFVVFSTIPFAWIYLLPDEFKNYSKALIYIPLYTSNILFYKQTNYFDTSTELNPLIHTWSLAIEEQFYIVFPVILFALYRYIKKEITVLMILLTACLLSLLFVTEVIKSDQNKAFYLFQFRFWELLLGSCLAIYLGHFKSTNAILQRNFLSILGFISLIFCVIFFDENTSHPSIVTLIPVLSTCLIIFQSDKNTIVGKILGHKLLVSIGLMSYSIYLWHQPILAFYRYQNIDELNTYDSIIILAIIFILSFFSYQLIEKKTRYSKITTKKVIIFWGIATALSISAGAYGKYKDGFHERFRLPKNIEKQFAQDYPCRDSVDICYLGNTSKNNIDIAVFGDSHGLAMLPAFEKIAAENNYKIAYIGSGGCPPIAGVYLLKGNLPPAQCAEIIQRQIQLASTGQVKQIYLVGRWSLYTDTDNSQRRMFYLGERLNDELTKEKSKAAFSSGIQKTVDIYNAMNIPTTILFQIPQQIFPANQIYYLIYKKDYSSMEKEKILQKYSVSQEKHLKIQEFSRQTITEVTSNYINFDKYFCNTNLCHTGTQDNSYYRDKDHLSVQGSQMLIDELKKTILK